MSVRPKRLKTTQNVGTTNKLSVIKYTDDENMKPHRPLRTKMKIDIEFRGFFQRRLLQRLRWALDHCKTLPKLKPLQEGIDFRAILNLFPVFEDRLHNGRHCQHWVLVNERTVQAIINYLWEHGNMYVRAIMLDVQSRLNTWGKMSMKMRANWRKLKDESTKSRATWNSYQLAHGRF